MKDLSILNGCVVPALPATAVVGDQCVWNMARYTYTGTAWMPMTTRQTNVLYARKSWADLTDFTNVGSVTPTIVNGAIRFTGGTNDYTKYLTINNSANLDWNVDYTITYRWYAAEGSTTTAGGIAIGRISANAFFKQSTAAMDYNQGFAALVVYTDSGLTANLGTAGIYPGAAASGDICRLTYRQRGSTFYSIYQNITKGYKSEGFFQTSMPDGTLLHMPNSSQIAIYNIGESIEILGIECTSQSLQNPDIMCVGDSKIMGKGAISPSLSFASHLRSLGSYTIFCGDGDNTQDIVNALPRLVAYNPQQVLLLIGYNDVANSVSSTTYEANIATIVAAFVAKGIKVVPMLSVADTSGVVVTTLNSYISSTYASTYLDSTCGGTYNSSTMTAGDGKHPNILGHQTLGRFILGSGKLSAGTPYMPDSPVDQNVVGYPSV